MSATLATVIDLPIAEIVVANRIRSDRGKIESLADSIKAVGLLHPIVLNSRRELVAGERRLTAAKSLGWKTITCRVVATLDDAVNALIAERDENTCRRALSDVEMMKAAKMLAALERPDAQKRQAEHGGTAPGKPKDTPGNLPQVSAGRVRDKVATALDVSPRHAGKLIQLAEAVEKEPEKFGDLPAVIEQKSVDAAHKELKRREAPTPVPEVSHPATSPTRTIAVSRADDAINVLRSIPRDDPQRARGLKMVAEWISLNGSPVVCGKAPDTKAAADDGKAIRMGHQAINALMQIRPGDPRRARAYQIVSDWMSQNPVATEATKQAEPPVASPNGSYLRDLLATYNEAMPPEHRYGLEEIAKFSGLALDRVKQLDQGEDPTFAERIMLLEAVEMSGHDDLTAEEFEALQRGRQSRADRKKRLMREQRRARGNGPSIAQES